jgi:hypothetical protein
MVDYPEHLVRVVPVGRGVWSHWIAHCETCGDSSGRLSCKADGESWSRAHKAGD